MPYDPSSDPDFLRANPQDQHAFLSDPKSPGYDPEYVKAAPNDQQSYLGSFKGAAAAQSMREKDWGPVTMAERGLSKLTGIDQGKLEKAGYLGAAAGLGGGLGGLLKVAPRVGSALGATGAVAGEGYLNPNPGETPGGTAARQGAMQLLLEGLLGGANRFLNKPSPATVGTPEMPPRLNTTWVQGPKDSNAYPAPTILGPRGEIVSQEPIPGAPMGTIAPRGSDVRFEYQAGRPAIPPQQSASIADVLRPVATPLAQSDPGTATGIYALDKLGGLGRLLRSYFPHY